ncbi:MAG: tRNA pseudouridine(38-40) synthase TruA [Rhizobiaceae bacterium]
MPRYKLTIEYDGTGFYGWQRQADFISVQQALEEAIEEFTRQKIAVFGAGRTDTGVHALAQVAHIDLEKDWEPGRIIEASNGILKFRDHRIAVLECELVSEEFDARFSAKRRNYRYRIVNRQAPLAIEYRRAWWVRRPLDVEAMHEAAQSLVGHFDFTTFRSINCQAKSPMKTLDKLDVRRVAADEIEILASSRSFLHNQVRSMVGSLKLVGDGKWSKSDLEEARDALDRKACGPVAPACGLYLVNAEY